MSTVLFLSGNAGKLREFRALWPELQSCVLDLPEIQSDNGREIIELKLRSAAQMCPGVSLLVEDTALHLQALNGLPGPLIKWFIAPGSLGLFGLAELAQQRRQTQATARSWIGFLKQEGDVQRLYFSEGSIQGQIVSPRGEAGFGWDAIFQPDGSSLTFAEMSVLEKQRWSMRKQALENLQQQFQRSHQ